MAAVVLGRGQPQAGVGGLVDLVNLGHGVDAVGRGDEQPARFEDAVGLGHGGGDVGDVVEHVVGHDHVEAAGGEGQRQGCAPRQADGQPLRPRLGLAALDHRLRVVQADRQAVGDATGDRQQQRA